MVPTFHISCWDHELTHEHGLQKKDDGKIFAGTMTKSFRMSGRGIVYIQLSLNVVEAADVINSLE